MKRLLIPLFTLVVLAVAGTSPAADGMKIATVDLRKIAQESKAGAEATKAMSKLAETLEKKMKTKEAELEKIKAALEGKGKPLSPKERSAKEKEIRKKLDAYREAAQNAQKELLAKEEEYGVKIMAGIEKTVKEFAPKNGYTLVIRKGDVIYSDGKVEVTDVTDDILKLYDAPPPEGAEKKQ